MADKNKLDPTACPDEESILRYLNHRLSSDQTQVLEQHIEACDLCRQLVGHIALEMRNGTLQSSEIPAPTTQDEPVTPLAPGQHLDQFEILHLIGRGGMGEIYLAADTKLKRRVALKLISPHLADSKESTQRILVEARATARLNHPNIVTIYSVGEFLGRPYLALEYLPGESLRQRLQRPVTAPEAIKIALPIAKAIAAAHQQGVLHRDLKPDNIILGADQRLRVVDFGLARLQPVPADVVEASARSTLVTDSTAQLGVCGTPRYIAPEMWRGEQASAAGDIWALGIVLHELFVGTSPFADDALIFHVVKVLEYDSAIQIPADSGIPKRIRLLIQSCLNQTPAERPDATLVVDELQALRGEDNFSLVSQLQEAAAKWQQGGCINADLYAAAQLSAAQEKLEYWEDQLPPVVTRFLSASSRQVQRLEQKKKIRLLGLCAVAVVCAALALIFAHSSRQRAHEMNLARSQAERERASALVQGAQNALRQGRYQQARAQLRSALEIQDSLLARALWWQLQQDPVVWSRIMGAPIFDVAFAPNGKQVAAAGQDRTVYLIDVETQVVRSLHGFGDQVFGLVFSPDGHFLASSSWTGELRLWNLKKSSARILTGLDSFALGMTFSPDGRRLFVTTGKGSPLMWDLSGSAAATSWLESSKGANQLLFDAGVVLTAEADATVREWEVNEGQVKKQYRALGVQTGMLCVAVSSDGKRVVAGGEDGVIYQWRRHSGEELKRLEGHTQQVHRLLYSHDNRYLISASADKTVRVWDTTTGVAQIFRGYSGWNKGLALHPQRAMLVSAGHGNSVKLWSLVPRLLSMGPEVSTGHRQGVVALAFADDGASLATGSYDKTAQLWDLSRGEPHFQMKKHQCTINSVVHLASTDQWVSAGQDGRILLWRTNGQSKTIGRHTASVKSLALAADGRLASASYDGTVRIWSVSKQRQLAQLGGGNGPVFDVAFDPRGALLAAAGKDGFIRLWNSKTTEQTALLSGHEAAVWSVDFSPDGRHLVSGGHDKTVRLWDVASGTGRVLGEHHGRVYSVAYHPSGKHVASTGSDGRVWLWDLATLRFTQLRQTQTESNVVRFSPDGKWLASGADDGTVWLWDLEGHRPLWRAPLLTAEAMLATGQGWLDLRANKPLRPRPTLHWRRASVEQTRLAHISTDGRRLCGVDFSSTVHYWDLEADKQLFQSPGVDAVSVASLGQGCVALVDDKVLYFDVSGAFRTLQKGIVAMAVSPDQKILLAGENTLTIFDGAGETKTSMQISPGVTAVAKVSGRVILGYRNGSIEALSANNAQRVSTVFAAAPSSPVVAIAQGPMKTIMAGFANGYFGLWETETGAVILERWLHGPVRHIRESKGSIVAASQLGSWFYGRDIFGQDYCSLLKEVQGEIPFVWSNGKLVAEKSDSSQCQSRGRSQ